MYVCFGCREVGVIIQNVDINSGEVTVNLNEELLSRKKSSSDAFAHTDKELVADSSVSKNQHNKQSRLVAITKYASMFPEKVGGLSIYAIWMGLLITICPLCLHASVFYFSCFFLSMQLHISC
jgi:hypothetical protein